MSRRTRVCSLFLLMLAAVAAGRSGSVLARGSGEADQSVPPASQSSRVTITGSVVDASLNPLPGATVTLERDTRVVATTKTDASGLYRFANAAAGDYRVRASLAGFPSSVRDLHVPAGAVAMQLPFVLEPDGVRSDVMVTAGPPVVDTFRSATALPLQAPPPAASAGQGAIAGARGGGGQVGGMAGGGGAGGGRGGGMASGASASLGSASAAGGGQYLMPDRYRDPTDTPWSSYTYPHSGESYARVEPNRFQTALDHPISTFGADVDTASYTNVRRFLSAGQLPPRDAVRVEDFVNYFRFPYDEPRGNKPIALTTEVGECPWAPSHKLVLIGAKAVPASMREITGRSITLLIDVSGSMQPAERLPLIKTALGMFVDTLRPDDRIAIVTYAGTSGIALQSTPARYRDVIQRAIANLYAEGSTNGGQGLITAYRVARENFIPGGVNRVILSTDGDFNVGITSQNELVRLIERERDSGVFLSVFGVGTGNLKDSTMEVLADKGNGHYAYLDSLQEARRVLLREADATIENVAKDVKFQVEFNPAMVSAWKLIGYEDRLMAARDFNNDRKAGGEMGAGSTVTVLYEIVPVGVANPDDDRADERPGVDPLKYQTIPGSEDPGLHGDAGKRASAQVVKVDAAHAGEWLTVKARYKLPESEESSLITQPVRSTGRVQHLPLASAVAEFGLLLRNGTRDSQRWSDLERRIARLEVPGALMQDKEQFMELVSIAAGLMRLR
jgi:Ca-activated chloride channel family protein